MSRIDEALRRAASVDALPPKSDVERAADTTAFDAPMLDRYAAEIPAPALKSRAQVLSPVAEPAAVAAVAVAPVAAAAPPPARIPVGPVTIAAALQKKLVIGRDVSPVTVEQYRRLAAALHDYQVQHGLKTLMVTSAAPKEGKTLTVTNVALTLSESYRQRVLVVDADLRRPSLHQVFSIPNERGLSDLVNGATGIVPVQLSPYLSVMTAGRRLSSPLAMLTSDRIREVVAEAATN